MHSPIISLLQGYVKVRVRGKSIEPFLNQALSQNCRMWNIRKTAIEEVEMNIIVKDFFRLRPLLKKTSSRIHVLGRFGLPFVLDRLANRKLFVAGIIGFVIGLYILSNIIWQVDVQGNDTISTAHIEQVAAKRGIYPLQWKFRLSDPDTLSKMLASDLPSAAWVGVEVTGTQIVITIVESVQPEPRPLMSPRHLVATSDAVITDLFVEYGKAMVKPNARVRKGDILVSGIIGDEEHQQVVVAKGYVKGLVWQEYEIKVPLLQKYKVYTGEMDNRQYVVIGNRALRITGYGKPEYRKYEVQSNHMTLHWKDISIPIGWMHEKVMEVEYVEQPIEVEQAKTIGIEHARAKIMMNSGKEGIIKEQKILHEKVESGKVYMKVLFEVELEISEGQSIIQGD